MFSYLALLFPQSQFRFVITLLHQLERQLLVHLGQLLSRSQHIVHLITHRKQEINSNSFICEANESLVIGIVCKFTSTKCLKGGDV